MFIIKFKNETILILLNIFYYLNLKKHINKKYISDLKN
jgi:hypothetical protein